MMLMECWTKPTVFRFIVGVACLMIVWAIVQPHILCACHVNIWLMFLSHLYALCEMASINFKWSRDTWRDVVKTFSDAS